ncbi:cytochrome oxidase subunit III [Desulfuromonas versatilis]|uniref:Cytochrome oxidase subunit III n=1 Tax=Desulfuromonas versatilis TaxID=2802975 RepID=A0ABM8HZS5_9BACT|nr:cytochrome c oxidase subunit 3 family protein [Desulfuromonas versatilis]BCR06057.1 cytochrome oxidase subunit III [Desulfuromonas versatilis]
MSEVHKDYAGAKFGMWLFLFTELLLFGGLFILYGVYLHRYPEEFVKAGGELNVVFGAVNTLVLLTSSLAVAMSITALQKGNRRLTLVLLAVTIASALIFLVNKYFEWSAKIHHGLYPDSPHLKELAPGESVFFGLYYVTTGLHGLHVVIGGALLAWVFVQVRSGRVHAEDFVALENSGLYWHLVDLIWIFIFPLYYLIL